MWFSTKKAQARQRQREEEAAKAAEDAARLRHEKKWDILQPIISVFVIAAFVVAGMVLVPLIPKPPTWQQDMKSQSGIVNGQAVDIVPADRLSTAIEGSGTFILIAGKSTTTQQDELRVGYFLPSGKATIVKLPVASILFAPGPGEPSAKFTFKCWFDSESLQYNTDNCLTAVTVNLTLDEFNALVAS